MGCAELVTLLGIVLLGISVIVATRVQDRRIARDEHEDGGP